MKKIISALKNRLSFFLARKKNHKTEEDFYTFLFTKHPGWNGTKPNEDELIRWQTIDNALDPFKQDQDQQILEIGCGRGWMSNMLKKYGKVTAVDPIAPVIEYAKKLFPGIHFIAGTLPDLITAGNSRKYDL